MTKQRVRLGWVPAWDAVNIQAWTKRFIRDNAWRCDSSEDFDDLMQEAWLVFDRVTLTYPRVVDERHFFSLYKTALTNRFHDKSCHKTRREGVNVRLSGDVTELLVNKAGDMGNAGYVGALLAEMPEEVRFAMRSLTNTRPRLYERKRTLTTRENLSQRLQRALNLPKGNDPVNSLKELLSN